MNIKSYVRRGTIGESISYEELSDYQSSYETHEYVVAILEGKGRRKLKLTPKRFLYENYFEGSFIGVEDLLLEEKRMGAVGVYPGTHYVLWNSEDFLNAVRLNPPLMWRAIDSLSRRIRIYDKKQRHISKELLSYEPNIADQDENHTSLSIVDGLYKLSFSENDKFPPEILETLSVPFKKGESVIRQGDKTRDIYIILSGKVRIVQKLEGESEEIDTANQGDFIGEMSMFDGLPRSADVVAVTDLLLLKFGSTDFHLIFKLHSRWAMIILNTLAKRVEQRRQELEKFPIAALYDVSGLDFDENFDSLPLT